MTFPSNAPTYITDQPIATVAAGKNHQIRIQPVEFYGRTQVDLRLFRDSGSGFQSTGRGLIFFPDQLPDLIAGLRAAAAEFQVPID